MEEQRIIELLTRKMAGEATERELKELRELISRHPNAVYYEELLNELWESPIEKTSSDLQYDLHKIKFQHELQFEESEESIDEEGKKMPYRNLLKYKVHAAVVFFFFVAFIFAYLFYVDGYRRDSPLKTQIIAGKGVRKQLTLPDGTLVWLNSGSKLTYDADMNEKEVRSVYLTGEAFFNVAHDSEHPFKVYTDEVTVKVLGTVFNIKAYPDSEKSETTLLSGSIELSVNNRTQQHIILKPSEKFVLTKKEKETLEKKDPAQSNTSTTPEDLVILIENIAPIELADKKYIPEISWKENKLVFQNESFEELAPRLERWFDVTIQIDKKDIKSYRFTGVFTSENIQEALEAMQLVKSFNFKIQDHEIIIY